MRCSKKRKRDYKTGMDQLKSLLGVYDPNIDKLAAEFRSRTSSNFGALNDVIKQGDQVKGIIGKIPGVSEETKNQIQLALDSAKLLTGDPTHATPDQLASQKDKLALLMKTVINKAQQEGKKVKNMEEQKKVVEIKEKKANEVFSARRLLMRMWNTGKYYLFIFILLGLALWGGSMSSNAAINKPVAIRAYYFIYGSLLFPLSFAFAIYRSFTGQSGSYYAMLAPLVPRPVYSSIAQYLLFPFLFDPPGIVTPIPIEPAFVPQYNSETSVMIQADANEAISSIGTQV